MRGRAALAGGLALWLAGCAGEPARAPPPPHTPAGWEYAGDATAVWPAADWWRTFGSEELDSLVAEAMAGNHDLGAAAARVLQSEAQARIAGAPRYPELAGSGSAGRAQASGLGRAGASTSTTWRLGLNATYEVDFWGKNRAAAEAARTRVLSSRFDAETVALTVLSNVASTYFEVLSLRDRVRLARASLANAEDVLQLLRTRARVGTASDLEVAQQRSAAATRHATIPNLVQQERQAVDALAVLLARNPEALRVKAESLDTVRLPPVVAGLPSELLRRRPDVRKAEAELRAGGLDVAAAHAARFPSVTLTAAGGSESLALSSLLGSGTFFYNLAAAAAAPLFTGGRLEGEEDLARARYRELARSYAQSALDAFRDVEDALSSVRQTQSRYEYSREAYESAREAYRLAALRYRVGTVDFLTVLDAQRSVFETEDALVVTNLARFDAGIALYRALGGGWGERQVPDGN